MQIDLFEFYDEIPNFSSSKTRVFPVTPKAASLADIYQELYDKAQFDQGCPTNPDGLLDCLSELATDPRDAVILHLDVPALPPEELASYIRVLSYAAESWGGPKDWHPKYDNRFRIFFPMSTKAALRRLQI